MKLLKFKSIIVIFIAILLLTTGCENLGTLEDSHALGENSEKNLVIHFLDVGQADSIFIQLPNGKTSLIDGGNRADSQLIIDHL